MFVGRCRRLTLLMFASLLLGGVLFEGTAQAGYADLPQELPVRAGIPNLPETHQYINLSTPDNEGRAAYATESWIKVYNDPPSSDMDIYLELTDRRAEPQISCKDYRIKARIWYLNSNETLTGANVDNRYVQNWTTGTSLVDRCSGDTNYAGYHFTVRASEMVFSSVEGHENTHVGLVQLIVEPEPGKTTGTSAAFQLRVADGRLGYYGDANNTSRAVTVYPSLRRSVSGPSYPVPDTAGPPDPPPYPVHTISYKFGVPCEFSGNSFRFRWSDDDQGSGGSTQNNPDPTTLRVRVIETDRNGAVTRNLTTGGGGLNPVPGWSGDTDTRSYIEIINAQAGFKYRVDFENIRGGNAIPFYFPFDSADFNSTCKPPPVPPEPTCTTFQHSLGSHSIYRFTSYPRNQNYVSSSPAEGSLVSGAGNHGAWKSFNAAPDFQSSEQENSTDFSQPYSFNHTALNGPDRLVYIERWHHYDANGNGTIDWQYTSGTSLASNCYTLTPQNPDGSCSMRIVSGVISGTSNGVAAGTRFGVVVTLRNTGVADLPASNGGVPLGVTVAGPDWGGAFFNAGGGVLRGQARDVYFELDAPNDVSSRTLSVYPDYPGKYSMGGCSMQVNMYQPFDITPIAGSVMLDNIESPTSATFNSSANNSNSGYAVTALATRVITRNGAPIGSWSSNDSFGSQFYTDIATGLITPNFGDRYCGTITISPASGYSRPGDTVVTSGSRSSSTSTCAEVVNLPYIRTFGADVAAGGGFNGVNSTCGATASGIFAFMRPLNEQTSGGNRSGSGAQLAVMALGNVSGFTSASLRSTPPSSTAGNGLTFAHDTSTPNQTSMDALLGGGMSAGNGWCAPDYFTETQFSTDAKKPDGTARVNIEPNNSPVNIQFLDDQEQTIKTPPSGNVLLRAPAAYNFSRHHTVYVEGDVFIENNIVYIPSYPNIQSIPSFALIVRGNIYIDNNVTQLDGMYVAQPKSDGTKGRIYTCARVAGGYVPVTDSALMFSACGASGLQPRLTVNGALIAQRVLFNRTIGSLRDSRYQEGPYMPNASSAAEIINFSPEMFLSPPVFRATGTATSGDYDYITTLPPIL